MPQTGCTGEPPGMSLQVQLLISAQDVENYKVIKSELDKLRTMVEKSELWVDKKGNVKGDSTGDGNKKEKKEVRALSKVLGRGLGGRGAAHFSPTPGSSQWATHTSWGRVLWGAVVAQALERCGRTLTLLLSPRSTLLMKKSLLQERRAARTTR